MVNRRKPVASRKPIIKNLRSRLYSTEPDAPRIAFTPTHVEKSNANARYPLVESHFSDAALQPWIHDFRIRLQHGRKVTRFRIFLKHGKALAPNAYADNIVGDIVLMRVAASDITSVVNMRGTDARMADYVFNAALERIDKFQSATRTLPPEELVVHRAQAFPGSP
ncbi:hypothetical protein GGX14DRAFT_407360 [Mycena pura]|uniref:Uncharacterized protein n=1 Tax=Mycena pura TaxID=153505 RepID=A0AAD6UN43_9AGAR|nr:hypothetical protein GGX14DRAFT_407360 [Mycena pura]